MKRFEDKPKKKLRFKLSADEGFQERPIYTIKAWNTELEKGIGMIELIENNFSISKKDREEKREKEIMETKLEIDKRQDFIKQIQKPIEWQRDDKGNIVSPFASKKKLV